MDTTIEPAELVCDFKFAQDVLKESDHLGLDEEHARLLHGILQRRIDEGCAAISVKPAEPIRIPVNRRISA